MQHNTSLLHYLDHRYKHESGFMNVVAVSELLARKLDETAAHQDRG